ncbi:hypothetical protein VTK73DRAFT_549 [Phialemonium thermophilum]|uniref:AATF leucine zipper-containing domain-containing protein n=1 Tax=Phialemonium thermophilum TaxID=223376 RepID=A0ABR3VUT5_9PEZI
MAPRKNRAQRLADLEERPVKDYDPEGDASQNRDESGSDSEASEDGLAGTEHYVAVGKSRLRQREEVPLGPQYRGAKISRADLEEMSDENDDDDEEEEDEEEGEEEDEEEEEEEDGDSDGGDSAASSTEFADPDKVDLDADQAHADDAEIESDNAFGESDAERFKDFKFRASKTGKAANGDASSRSKAADFFSSDEDRMGHEQDDGDDSVSDDGSDAEPNGAFLSDDDEEASEDGTDASDGDSVSGSGSEDDEDDEKDDEESGESAGEDEADAQRAELRRILSEGQKSIMATVSQAAKADAAKGVAVRQQRRTFDALLHLRIRLQKALVAANSFGVVDDDGGGGSGGGSGSKQELTEGRAGGHGLRKGDSDASGGNSFDRAPLPLGRSGRKHTVASVMVWQLQNHAGFVPAFVSSIRHAPIYERREEWAALGRLLAARRAQSATEPSVAGLRGGKVLLVLGASDPVVVREELIQDATKVLGSEAFEVAVFDSGHEVAIVKGREVADAAVQFWQRQTGRA